MRAAAWLLPGLLSACYLSPDKHRAVEDPSQSDDAGISEMDGGDPSAAEETGSLEGGAPPADGSLEPPPEVDAGCVSHEVCPASAPICREGSCVPCAQHGDCARFPSTPACGPMGACVVCATDSAARCTGATPACDPSTNQCVACTADSHCTSTGATPACDPSTKQCVQCTADMHCPSEERAACRADRTCGGCSEDADCARFGKVCEASSGECVECRPGTEEVDCRSDPSCNPANTDCAGTACDPKLLTCTATARGSLDTCQACVSDSECATNHRCISMFYGEGANRQELGGFCLRTASGCMAPYTAPPIQGRTSLSGHAPEAYCGIDERATSCPAIRAVLDSVPCSDGTAAACGAVGARCETVNAVASLCTYSCLYDTDCPPNRPCGGSQGSTYCGGP